MTFLNDDERNLKRMSHSGKIRTYGIFELPEVAVLRHHDSAWVKKVEDFETLSLRRLSITP
jgi:hypothetical protein